MKNLIICSIAWIISVLKDLSTNGYTVGSFSSLDPFSSSDVNFFFLQVCWIGWNRMRTNVRFFFDIVILHITALHNYCRDQVVQCSAEDWKSRTHQRMTRVGWMMNCVVVVLPALETGTDKRSDCREAGESNALMFYGCDMPVTAEE